MAVTIRINRWICLPHVSGLQLSLIHICDTLKHYAVNGIIANADNKRLKEKLASAEKTVSIWKQRYLSLIHI